LSKQIDVFGSRPAYSCAAHARVEYCDDAFVADRVSDPLVVTVAVQMLTYWWNVPLPTVARTSFVKAEITAVPPDCTGVAMSAAAAWLFRTVYMISRFPDVTFDPEDADRVALLVPVVAGFHV
jgi:hypothetical protein